jgi:GT2 family glycosyltransferase
MLERTVDNLLQTSPPRAEVIVVDDGSTDGSTDRLPRDRRLYLVSAGRGIGPAAARNLGARRARGNIILFSDAHIEAPPAWFGPIRDALASPQVGAAGPGLVDMLCRDSKGYGFRLTGPSLNWAWLPKRGDAPYAVQFLGGFFLGMTREVFRRTGGFDAGFRLWGMEDMELVLRLWCLGYRCLMVPGIEVAHLSRQDATCPPYQLDWETGLHNTLRVAALHLKAERIERVLTYYRADTQLPRAISRLAVSDVWQRRERVQAERSRDDDWFFHRFGLNW